MTELAQVRGTLQQAEQECTKLHALAATAAAMIDEAYQAFGTEQPPRHFAVLCDFDTPTIPLPLGDGTVGISTAASDRMIESDTHVLHEPLTVVASGTTFAQFQAGGASGHLELLIAAQGATLAPTVAATLAETGSGGTLPAATYYCRRHRIERLRRDDRGPGLDRPGDHARPGSGRARSSRSRPATRPAISISARSVDRPVHAGSQRASTATHDRRSRRRCRRTATPSTRRRSTRPD